MTVRNRRMIRADLLKPGDVLLSRSRGLFSTLTRLATAGGDPRRLYSHAALVIWGQSWFESNDNGVGFLFKRIDKAERHDNDLWRLIDVSNYVHFDVYRHPVLDKNHDVEIDSALTNLIFNLAGQWAGREYPPLRRLSGTTPLLSNVPRVKRFLGDVSDKLDQLLFKLPGVVAPGPFCSELVARIYGELACKWDPVLNLFKSPLGARLASPNDLADSSISMLEPCPNLVVHENPDISDCRDKYINPDIEVSNETTTRETHAALVASVRNTAVVQGQVRKIEQISRNIIAWSRKNPL